MCIEKTPVLILNGTIGAGKSTIGMAIHDVLMAKGIPHVFLDLDQLTYSWPKKGAFNSDAMFEALAQVWPIYKSAGADRLVLARVIEKRETLEKYEQALGPCSFTLVHIKASEGTRKSRIAKREFGDSIEWHINRTVELEAILEKNETASFTVQNEGKAPEDVAVEIIERVGWVDTIK